MSFAPKKNLKNQNENFPLQRLRSSENMTNVVNITLKNPQDIDTRLNLIEESLNRLCTQQDALGPIYELSEIIPTLTKSEQIIKNISKKSAEQDEK